jgi:hypothetical protein
MGKLNAGRLRTLTQPGAHTPALLSQHIVER